MMPRCSFAAQPTLPRSHCVMNGVGSAGPPAKVGNGIEQAKHCISEKNVASAIFRIAVCCVWRDSMCKSLQPLNRPLQARHAQLVLSYFLSTLSPACLAQKSERYGIDCCTGSEARASGACDLRPQPSNTWMGKAKKQCCQIRPTPQAGQFPGRPSNDQPPLAVWPP